jgi:small multidrug resistance pump
MPAWVTLAAAILSEVAGTVALRFTDGFRRPLPTAIVAVGYALSFWFLSLTLRTFPLSLTYAIWAAVGTALVATVGVVALGEPITAVKLLGLVLVIAGVVALNVSSAR